jgi:hypothetical protein
MNGHECKGLQEKLEAEEMAGLRRADDERQTLRSVERVGCAPS